MIELVSKFRARLDREEGATAVEYGLMVALIAVVIIAAVTAVGTDLRDMFNAIANSLTPPAAPAG